MSVLYCLHKNPEKVSGYGIIMVKGESKMTVLKKVTMKDQVYALLVKRIPDPPHGSHGNPRHVD